ncbi:MAG: glycoside hydrolase family 27 protein [archaeon]|nr:glycoside hydrolase family 27 protein [archaeon]
MPECGAPDYCNEKEVQSIADSLVESGMADLGYRFVNLDDCWSAETRTAAGELQGNPKRFPSGMAALADYIHSRGLFFGLYTCVGTETCRGGRPGSFGYYEQDASTLAGWGVDFVKADKYVSNSFFLSPVCFLLFFFF